MSALPPPTIPSGGALSWWSQATQYPARHRPGTVYFPGDVGPDKPPIDCLLAYDNDGYLVGILNHYPVDYPPWEEAGNINLWVHPKRQRKGIGTGLLLAALDRWNVDPTKQRFTPEGHALATTLLERLTDAQ